jgi:hypothetical protein
MMNLSADSSKPSMQDIAHLWLGISSSSFTARQALRVEALTDDVFSLHFPQDSLRVCKPSRSFSKTRTCHLS